MVTSSGTPVRIAVFGALNVGKSSLANALAGHDTSEVSDLPGTTTDTISVEGDIQPLGGGIFIDTPGYHHGGRLGARWIDTARQVMDRTDMVIVVTDATNPELTEVEQRIYSTLDQRAIPCINVVNKADLVDPDSANAFAERLPGMSITVSAKTGQGIPELRMLLREQRPDVGPDTLVGDLIGPGDVVVMVLPGTCHAPKGQVTPIHANLTREIMDRGAMPLSTTEQKLPQAMTSITRPPALVIADSGQMERLAMLVPPDIPLTTFATLQARKKGCLNEFVHGMEALDRLQPGDSVLIAEGCRHRPLHEDELQNELPATLRTMVGGPLRIEYVSGNHFPTTVSDYRLVIHCTACALQRRDVLQRQTACRRAGVPMITIGMLQSHLARMFDRTLEPLRAHGVVSGTAVDETAALLTPSPGPRPRRSGRSLAPVQV
jgi:[FeFe] hydrogenase H-cluster maturation GTPase HydF